MSIFFLRKSDQFLTDSLILYRAVFQTESMPKISPLFLQYAAGCPIVTSKNKIEIHIYLPMNEFFSFYEGMHLKKEPILGLVTA